MVSDFEPGMQNSVESDSAHEVDRRTRSMSLRRGACTHSLLISVALLGLQIAERLSVMTVRWEVHYHGFFNSQWRSAWTTLCNLPHGSCRTSSVLCPRPSEALRPGLQDMILPAEKYFGCGRRGCTAALRVKKA